MTLLLRHNCNTKMTKAGLNTELTLLRKLEQIYLNGKTDGEFNLLDFLEEYNSKILLFPLIYSDLTKTSLRKLYDNIINYVIKELRKRLYLWADTLKLLTQIISTSILIQYLIFESDIDKNIRRYRKTISQIRKEHDEDILLNTYTAGFNSMSCEFNLFKYSKSAGIRFPVVSRSKIFTVINSLRNIIMSGSHILGYRINPVYLSIINRRLKDVILMYPYSTAFVIPLPVVI